MPSKKIISKTTIFLLVVLLFSSFKFPDWEFNKRYTTKIHNSISELFNSDLYKLNKAEESFYTIKEADNILGYFVFAKAPSKFHEFDYYIIFDNNGLIMKVQVLQYRENYGAEICSKRWLKKFITASTSNFTKYNQSIDGISGATISVNSIKNDVFKLTNALKKSINK